MNGYESQNGIKEGVKGAFLWEEPEGDVQQRRGYFFKVGIMWFGMWSIGLYFMWLILPPATILFAVVMMVGILFFLEGIFLLPHIIYENGAEYGSRYPLIDMEYRTFISWGEMSGFVEIKRKYIFECSNKRNIHINKEALGISVIVDRVKDRVGKEEYLIYVDLDERIKRMRRKEFLIYPASFIGAIGFYFVFTLLIIGPRYITRIGLNLNWMIVPAFSVLFAIFLLHSISGTRKKENIKVKLDLRVFVIFFIVMSLIYYANLDIEFVMRLNDDPRFDYIFEQTDPIGPFVNNSVGFFNETIEIDKILMVTNGSEFRILNSNVTFEGNGSLGIYVGRNSSLRIENSMISCKDPQIGYYFEVYGTLLISNSTIMNVEGDTEQKNLDGGIEIYKAKCIFKNSTISMVITNGILAYDSDLSISSCKFENCGDDAIELHRTDAMIEDCSFINNNWTIMLWQLSNASVLNCTFENNSYGIWIAYSFPRIENNIFRDTQKGSAIGIKDWYSDPILSNNTYVNNEKDIRRPDVDIIVFYYVVFGGPVLGTASVIFFHIKNKKIMRKSNSE